MTADTCGEPSPDGRWRCTEPIGHGGRHYALGPPTEPVDESKYELVVRNPMLDGVGCWWLP